MTQAGNTTSPASGSLADVAERLMAEFEGRVGLAAVSAVVRDAAHDLHGSLGGAQPELVERYARQRLLEQALPLEQAAPSGP